MLTYWDPDCLVCTGGNHDDAAKGGGGSREHICARPRFITSAGNLSKSYLVIKF